ncbi:transposase-like protein [Fusarium oxysporum f. sp. phaseoli]
MELHFRMISRALVKQGDIRAFLVHPEVEKWLSEADMLKGDGWRLLAEVKHVLEPFYLQIMRTQGWGSEGGNGRLWEVITGVEYLLEHLEDRKLFYHAVPEEVVGENTNSQAETTRGRPDRNRQLPARFRDCEMDMHPRKSMERSLPGRSSGQCADGSGKPSG